MDDPMTSLNATLTDIRERVIRLEMRSDHNEGAADRTQKDIGEVKAMITELRKDFDKELAGVKALITCMQESVNEKIAKVRVKMAGNAAVTGIVVSLVLFIFKKFF